MPGSSAHAAAQAAQAALAAVHASALPTSDVSHGVRELQQEQKKMRIQLSEEKRRHVGLSGEVEQIRKIVHTLQEQVRDEMEKRREDHSLLTRRIDGDLSGLCQRFTGMMESFRREVANRSNETGAVLDVLEREVAEVKTHSSSSALKLKEHAEVAESSAALAARRQSDIACSTEARLRESYDVLAARLSNQETAWEGRWEAIFQLTKASGAAVEDLSAQCSEFRVFHTASKEATGQANARQDTAFSKLVSDVHELQEKSNIFKAESAAIAQALELQEQQHRQRHGQLRQELGMLSHMVDTSLDLASDTTPTNVSCRHAPRSASGRSVELSLARHSIDSTRLSASMRRGM